MGVDARGDKRGERSSNGEEGNMEEICLQSGTESLHGVDQLAVSRLAGRRTLRVVPVVDTASCNVTQFSSVIEDATLSCSERNVHLSAWA